jgi:hypothetical protein
MIVYNNIELEIDEYHIINLLESDNISNINIEALKINYEDYPVKFQLPAKYFKKIINDIRKFSDIFTIDQMGQNELQFSYYTTTKIIRAKHICRNTSNIKLISTIKENDIFSVSTYIESIRTLSNSLISDDIHIYADKQNELVFKLIIDNGTFELTIYTKIIQYN